MNKKNMKKKKSHYIVPVKTKPSKALPDIYVLDEEQVMKLGMRLLNKGKAS